MRAVISALENATDPEMATSADRTANRSVPEQKPKEKTRPGQIGEGKGVPLSKAQRKRALYVRVLLPNYKCTHSLSSQMERLRHPMILSNPEFSLNPFQTIRTHAQNTLIKRNNPA